MFLFTTCMECCGHVNCCLRILIDKEESNEKENKRTTIGTVGKLSVLCYF